MLPRLARHSLARLLRGFPVVAVTGPRQSGKTTLVRSLLPERPYVSLENPDAREFALQDPRGFLAQFPGGAVLDEVQRAPQLLSWLLQRVDESRQLGEWVLTGSAQLDLMAGLTQTLAGRVGRLELLPFAAAELGARLPSSLDETLLRGGYPALFDRPVAPQDWFAAYVASYLERDVRQLVGVRDLLQFQRFVRLCAARSGQMLNLAALGNDAGVSAVTARKWLSVLEASYLVTRLPPYHQNFGKRLVKTPKLYFLDSGLLAWLLGIRDAATLAHHPARGALFEGWVLAELLKWQHNAAQPGAAFFWRDHIGNEVDLLLETPEGLQALEIKSGQTFASDWAAPLQRWQGWAQAAGLALRQPMLVWGGVGQVARQGLLALGWRAYGLGLGRG